MHYTELDKFRNEHTEETFDFAYVQMQDVQPLRVRTPMYQWVRRMVDEIKVGQVIYVALPEGVTMPVFQARLRSLLAAWKESWNWKWSVRQDKKGRGVYLLKAVGRNDGWSVPLSTHPEPLSEVQTRRSPRMVVNA